MDKVGMTDSRRGLLGLDQDGRMLLELRNHGNKSDLSLEDTGSPLLVKGWAGLQRGSPCASLSLHMPGVFYV